MLINISIMFGFPTVGKCFSLLQIGEEKKKQTLSKFDLLPK